MAEETVLVVDDEADLADLYAEWLSAEYEVRTAYDGERALAQLDSDVDYVLLDRRMPGLSGDEVLEAIRTRGAGTRVAMVTAIEPDFDILEMGFDDYIVKPITRSELLALVEDLGALDAYEDVVQRLYRLSAKKATLETTKSEAELAESDDYQRLVTQFEELKARADDVVESEDPSQLFETLL